MSREELVAFAGRFIDELLVYAVIDNVGILEEKESPTDDPKKFKRLISECIKRIK